MFTIHAKGINENGLRQFDRYIGQFQNLEDAQKGARFLSNSKRIPLQYYSIVDRSDVSKVIVAEIQPGKAEYVHGAKMG